MNNLFPYRPLANPIPWANMGPLADNSVYFALMAQFPPEHGESGVSYYSRLLLKWELVSH